MDCVGCEKCRLWGKLQVTKINCDAIFRNTYNLFDETCMLIHLYMQVQGIGTALKILFNDVQKLKLRRTEIVALFNALGR